MSDRAIMPRRGFLIGATAMIVSPAIIHSRPSYAEVPARLSLSEATTFYINPSTGIDGAGHGTSESDPFATRAYAFNWCQDNLDLRGKQLVFKLANGTYTDTFSVIGKMVGQVLRPMFIGDVSNPWNVIIKTPGHCFDAFNDCEFGVTGMMLQSDNASGLFSQWNSRLFSFNNFFGACGFAHMQATKDAWVFQNDAYQIWGSAPYHAVADMGQVFISGGNAAVCKVFGTPSFSGAFVYAVEPKGYVASHTMKWEGANGEPHGIVGKRFIGTMGGSIAAGGSAQSYYPGTIPGVVDPPGVLIG